MPVLPDRNNELIEFFEAHAPVWALNGPALGLSIGQTNNLTGMTTLARTHYDAAITARNEARAAVQTQQNTLGLLRMLGGDLIKVIRAKAEADANFGLYALAQIPAPAAPQPLPPPEVPENLSAGLDNAGRIALRWSALRRGGVYFTLERSTTFVGGQSGGWVGVGTAQENRFTDETIPLGLAAASYRVTARRGEQASEPSEPVTVLFGTALAA